MNVADMKEIKERHGYTNEMIAKKSGVPLSTVQKIFAGVTKHPRFETLRALEMALCGSGLPADSLGEYAPQAMVCEAAAAYGTKACAPDEEGISDGERTGHRTEHKEAAPEKKAGEYTLEDYYALPDNVRAELIDGNLILMESPSSIHQILITRLTVSLTNYIDSKKGKCLVFPAPMDVQLDCDDKTMLEPDVLVVCDRSKIIHRCVYGAPDFVAEILSSSTKRKDMTVKLTKYWNAGVREYWIVDPDRKKVITYCQPREEHCGFDYDVSLYGFDDAVPVGIFDGKCMIDFKEIYEYISFLY